MPKIKRTTAKSSAKASGVTGKAFRKQYQAQVKAANGGQSRLKRLSKGAIKIAAGAIPGVGGAIAGIISGDGTPKVDVLPTFQNETLQVGQPSMADVVKVNEALNTPKPALPDNTPVVNDVPPALVKNAPTTAPTMKEVAAQNAASAGGGGDDYEEENNGRTGASYAPPKGVVGTPEPKKKSKLVYWVVGGLVLLTLVIVIVKATSKK